MLILSSRYMSNINLLLSKYLIHLISVLQIIVLKLLINLLPFLVLGCIFDEVKLICLKSLLSAPVKEVGIIRGAVLKGKRGVAEDLRFVRVLKGVNRGGSTLGTDFVAKAVVLGALVFFKFLLLKQEVNVASALLVFHFLTNFDQSVIIS